MLAEQLSPSMQFTHEMMIPLFSFLASVLIHQSPLIPTYTML